ncbi:MAG TPA: LysR substrate-binding domain-containing protein [Alphaproteobacteria bacterium]|nr:LysR substrate-binding domain-containing protein [Alphaproteobacteria bacterium]
MNAAQLRAFHAVASAGGFTRAAARLGVTQPTLSGQVKALEESYGVALIERRGRQLVLTEIGAALLDLTRRIFGLTEEAEQLLSAARGLERGHLRLGADAPYHVLPALGDFTRRYPKLRLSLTVGNSETLIRDLFDHRIDVAVVANLAPDARLHAVPVRRDRLVLFVPKRHPWARRKQVTPDQLAGERLVLREPGSSTRRVFEAAMARAGIALEEVIEINSREAVREAVAAGLGVGVVSESEFGNDPRLVKVALAEADLGATEYVACLAERRELRLIRAFLEIVENNLFPAPTGKSEEPR